MSFPIYATSPLTWALVLLVLLAILAPGIALAHPKVVRTEPATDAQLSASPPWVRTACR